MNVPQDSPAIASETVASKPAPPGPMDLPLAIGATVHTVDGPAGWLERVVISPRARNVTHLIVGSGWPLPILGRSIVVPIAVVRRSETDGDRIVLDVTDDELKALPGFVETEYLAPDPSLELPLGFERDQVLHRLAGGNLTDSELVISGVFLHRHKIGLPEELVTIRRGQRVTCLDGEAGHVEQVVIDRTTRHITHLALRCGRGRPFSRKHVVVPVDWILSIGDDEVVLGVGTAQLDQLREFHVPASGEKLAAAVQQALASDPSTATVARNVRVEARDGAIDLIGLVGTDEQKTAVERITAAVVGVEELRSKLVVAGEDLAATVAALLAFDPRTTNATIEVAAEAGTVSLMGTVDDIATREAAAEIARTVPGVTLVINELRVDSEAPQVTLP